MARIPSIRSLEAVVAVARLGSLASAGTDLGMSIPALSRRIAGLEKDLGVRLFERHPRGLVLTPSGERYQKQVLAALNLLRAASAGLRSAERDVVRLTTIPAFATRWLLPRLPSFRSEHPDVEVEVRTSLAYEDLEVQDLDLAIRLAPSDHQGGIELFPIHVMPVWSPAHLRTPCTPAALKGLTLLSPGHRPEFWHEWMERYGLDATGVRVREVDPLLLYELTLAGAGVAIGIEPLTTTLLTDGRLQGMRSCRLRSSRSFRLLTGRQSPSRSTKQFRDWIHQQAAGPEDGG